MAGDMSRMITTIAMILAAVLAMGGISGCGGSDVAPLGDQDGASDLNQGVTTVRLTAGTGVASRTGSSSISSSKGTTGLKVIYDDASAECLFETSAETGGGIQIVTGIAPTPASCTNLNSCILCTLGSDAPVASCSISCVGTVPSSSATAADSVGIFVTFYSTLHTNAPTAVGMVRYDAVSTGWTEFSMSNFPVATDFTGCDGTPGNFEVGLDMVDVVYDFPYWTATKQVNGYTISALNPDASSSPADQSVCETTFKYYAAMSLTGADTPGTTIDFSSRTITFSATMCDAADGPDSDPDSPSAACIP